MPLTQEERKERHYGFMCATMTGLLASGASLEDENHTKTKIFTPTLVTDIARDYADTALELFEKRWEGEEKV